jgi:hypothetical protein
MSCIQLLVEDDNQFFLVPFLMHLLPFPPPTTTPAARLLLNNNSLRSRIPAQLGQLTALTVLDLSSNQVTGEIPTQFGSFLELSECQSAMQQEHISLIIL